MPDGVVQWFDVPTGEADILAGRKHLRAHAADIEPVARRAGARVHFDIVRSGGVDRAIGVRLRHGTRVSHLQGRFGTLTGARTPDAKGAPPYDQVHPGLFPAAATHPLEVARAWAWSVAAGETDRALSLYAPDAVVHSEDGALTGIPALRAMIEGSPAFGSRRHAEVRGAGGTAVLSWPPAGPDDAGWMMRSRIEHALLAEQWIEPPLPLPATVTAAEGTVPVEVTTEGDVDRDAVDYAVEKLQAVTARIDEPILFVRVRLAYERHRSFSRPAEVQAVLDVNGQPVRAHIAGNTLREAVDLLERRLEDELEHRADRRLARRRRPLVAEAGEWRHADLPAERPEHYPRPVDERQLVRHKTFAIGQLSPDEAIFDMGQLGYDFYLFTDVSSGVDSLVARRPDGTFLLSSLDPRVEEPGPVAVPLTVSDVPPPELTLDGAVDRLNAGGEPFVFFANASTGRGNVVYLRYDGHYGLITPE